MTAQIVNRRAREERWTHKQFPLAAVHVFLNGAACIDTATGYVTKGAVSTTLVVIGTFDEEVDNSGGSAGDLKANVCLAHEVVTRRFVNGTGADEIVAADIGQPCYFLDDQTVSIVPTAHSLAGLIWDVDATKGVAVALALTTLASLAATPTITDFTSAQHGHTGASSGGVLAAPGITSFAAALHTHADAAGGGPLTMQPGSAITMTSDSLTIATPGKWQEYNVLAPFSANPQSIVLGTTGAARGDVLVFVADGSLNTQTVTYKVGATAISAAATASKRHVAICIYNGTTWACSLSVGP